MRYEKKERKKEKKRNTRMRESFVSYAFFFLLHIFLLFKLVVVCIFQFLVAKYIYFVCSNIICYL